MMAMKISYCTNEKRPCVRWVEKYLNDCLCNTKDEISFGFGIISLICWAVAEIPQIVTNFYTKSGSGVSLAFLFTWIVGDIFNLVGCILEPATLPTQFYTALLYTATTVVLVLQCIYYDHVLRWLKCLNNHTDQPVEDESNTLKPKPLDYSSKPTLNEPVEVPQRRDFYFTSARSLAGSDSSPYLSSAYVKAKSGPSVLEHNSDSFSSEDETIPQPPSKFKPVTRPWPIPRSAGYGTFLATAANFTRKTYGRSDAYIKMITGNMLLQEQAFDENVYGQWLGWLMAAIYMGGRIPQIWLNIKRGNVEGLNPLMFIFALIANATYVASILVRSTEWEKINANMPWLLDAIVCVALDLFIILQYVYYKYVITRKKAHRVEEYFGDYVEGN